MPLLKGEVAAKRTKGVWGSAKRSGASPSLRRQCRQAFSGETRKTGEIGNSNLWFPISCSDRRQQVAVGPADRRQQVEPGTARLGRQAEDLEDVAALAELVDDALELLGIGD